MAPLPRLALLALLFLLPAAALTGCAGKTNVLQVTQHLTLSPVVPGAGYVGYTGTSFSQSIGSGKPIHLLDASIESSTGELSWAASVTGTSPPATGSKPLLERTSFVGMGKSADLEILDTGDIHPLYPDGQNFRIYWTWQYASTMAQSYPDGVTVTIRYTLQIE